MRSLFLSVLIVLLFVGGAAAAQFGTPVATAEGFGDFSLTAGYSSLSADWDVNNSADFKEVKTRMDQFYVQAGMGLAAEWLCYGRLGLASLEADNAFSVNGTDVGVDDFQNGPVVFGTLGANGKLANGEVFDLGFFVQATYFDAFEDKGPAESGVIIQSNPVGSTALATEVEASFEKMWSLDIGLAVQAEVEGVDVYFGPVLYFSQTEASASASGLAVTGPAAGPPAQTLTAEGSVDDLREEGFIGLNLGARWKLDNGVKLDIEFEKRSNFNAGFQLSYDY